MKRSVPTLIAVVLALPAAAHADGPPVTSLGAGPEGVVDHGNQARFVALAAATETVVAKSRTGGGQVEQATVLDGRWGVPIVTEDGTSSGVSADGRTLVLFRLAKAYPRRRSTFTVLDLRSFSVARTLSLKGEWGFDALSPDGRWLYLVQQLSARDRTRYAVRVYDLRAGRLMPDPVVDPSEPDEPMRGLPITRVTGPSGRWEYTLYGGGHGHPFVGHGHPFVHALDTVARESICIDLPERLAHDRRLYELRLELRGNEVRAVHGERVVASADRRPPEPSRAGTDPLSIRAVAAAFGLLLLTATVARRRTRRRMG